VPRPRKFFKQTTRDTKDISNRTDSLEHARHLAIPVMRENWERTIAEHAEWKVSKEKSVAEADLQAKHLL